LNSDNQSPYLVNMIPGTWYSTWYL